MLDKTHGSEALIRRYYEAFNAGDQAGMLACVTDDIIHDVNEGPRRTGKTRFAEFLAHMGHTYRENLRDIVIMTSSDGVRASAEFTVHGAYLSDDVGLPPAKGQTYRIPAGAFFAIRNGQICRVTTYYNLSDWIAQVSG